MAIVFHAYLLQEPRSAFEAARDPIQNGSVFKKIIGRCKYVRVHFEVWDSRSRLVLHAVVVHEVVESVHELFLVQGIDDDA